MIEVLVVDDDFMVARIHTGFVERTPGFTVTGVAHTGAAGAGRGASGCSPTWCCSTSTCPTSPGSTCSGALREAAPEVDVLVISAAREADTVRRALRGGIVHYLMKPFSYDDLRVRLEHYQQAYAGLAERARPTRPTSTGCSGSAGSDKRLPKGFSAGDAAAGRGLAARWRPPTSPRPRRPACSGSPGSAPGGTSSTSPRPGKVEVSLRYGEVGRPERRYAWR